MMTLSRRDLTLIVKALNRAHLALEEAGEAGSEEHRRLRHLEDELGSVSGDKWVLTTRD